MTLFAFLIAPTIFIYLGLYTFQNVPVTFALFYGWLLLVPLLNKPKSLKKLMDKRSLLNITVGVGLGVGSIVLIMTGGALLPHELFDSSQIEFLLKDWKFSGEYTGLLVCVLIIVNPFLEELYWRGFILLKLDKVKQKVMISSLFYSLYHFLVLLPMFKASYTAIFFCAVFLAGIVWGRMVVHFRTLWGSILSHSLADIGIMMIYFFYISSKM
ncbi:CPBP family intramembrane glutamic endopeptidase [Paenibacillus alba]|uniref:CPBP family intramembrane metalloprotease n=1 Tax=Paenibacillus alba TaxID=1197127 RepID=A0ABU6G8T7_9BACL|nr:CPBP family intramembrane glutamic endopeptidase [Paenibacillus alba]MEC0230613.1 CPBP family intramembrane metalloprotease [Paenibacillus alba]